MKKVILILLVCLAGIWFLYGCTTTKTITETETKTNTVTVPIANVSVPAGEVHRYRGNYKLEEYTGATAVKDALAEVEYDDVLYVGEGTYNAGAIMTINKNAEIYGADNAARENVVMTRLSISGIFDVQNTKVLRLRNLTVASGNANQGGGIAVQGYLIMDNVIIRNCVATAADGGGIWNNGTSTIRNCLIEDNTSNAATGAGIFNAGILSVYGTLFKDNMAQTDGGAIYNLGSLETNNCIYLLNIAPEEGGGVYDAGAFPMGQHEEYNCIYYGNKSEPVGLGGGGLFIYNTQYKGRNNIYYANEATSGVGPQIYFFDGGMGGVDIEYSCIEGGTYHKDLAPLGPDPGDLDMDLLGGGPWANISGDPLFVDPTYPADNYSLQTGSPCIDTGTADGGSAPATDMDKIARPQPTAGNYDMGAYER